MTVVINGTSGITDVNGTAAAPAITGTDTDTGVFFGTNTVSLSTGGTERLQIDSSGNLGLGVTPSAWNSVYRSLQIGSTGAISGRTDTTLLELAANAYRNSGGSFIYLTSDLAARYDIAAGVHRWYNAASGTAGNAITFTQAMTLNASGRLQLGTTVTTAGRINVEETTSGIYVGRLDHSGASSPYGIDIYYSGTSPNNTISAFVYCEDTGGQRAAFRSNGGLANYSGNNVNLSDRREKTNFAPAGDYLAKICAIPVQTFNYIDQNLEEDDGLTLGVVAQDVQAVAPELVMESNWAGKDEEPKMRLSIYQTDLQYALMKCIQEQQAIITQLQADIETLKGKA